MSRYSKYKKLIFEDKRSIKFDFNDSGKIHYVYRITEIKTNEHYYGSRTQKTIDILEDFWSYCTSSKRKKIILENKNKYKVKIIKKFNNKSEMIIYESFLHNYFNVKQKNNNFFNEANQTPFFFTCEWDEERKLKQSNTIKGRPQSKEHIEKRTKSSKRRKHTDSFKKNMSESKKVLYRDKTNHPMFGRKHSEESIIKNKKSNSLLIQIFDDNDELKFTSDMKFEDFCLEHNLPFKMFKKSYQEKGSKLYKKRKPRNKDWEKYKGWYALNTCLSKN